MSSYYNFTAVGAAGSLAAHEVSDCDQLVGLFNRLFADAENTVLVKGGLEPVYLPSSASEPFSRIIFTQDYFSSALHEIAHWCVAGAARRQREDYGYWYAPDGRTAEQQQAFEKVEVKPQALEWIFHVACKRRFRVSADNLEAGLGASDVFKADIYAQVVEYCTQGLSGRAERFVYALAGSCGVLQPLACDNYALADL